MSSKMITCKSCGAEIAASAKACPKCGGRVKKPIYKRLWFIILAVIVVCVIISTAMNSGSSGSGSGSSGTASSISTASSDNSSSSSSPSADAPQAQEETITYTAYSVSVLMNDLDSNALGASEKYKGQYVELTGRLGTIDSSGKYISLMPEDNEWAFIGVHCNIKTDEQKSIVAGLTKDSIITVKGRITDVGEVLGYYLDIDEIL